MTQRRNPSPPWDGRNATSRWNEENDEVDDESLLNKAIRGLTRRVTQPNRRDPSNKIINGAASGQRSMLRNIIANAATQLPRTGENIELLTSLFKTQVFEGGMVNDRDYQMEDIVRLASSLPTNSGTQEMLSTSFIKVLWNNLEHPPLSLLGNDHRYRMADGSNNNLMYPHLGKAGSNYARSVTPETAQPGVLPDPEVIFQSLMAREGLGKEHPNKISSVLFHFATIIIHDCFNTDPRDHTKVKTSSYLDLAPLYGSSEEELATVRTFKDGLLKNDTFAESRILGFPPGTAALLICFNRYHNYIATQLKQINEHGRFQPPNEDADEETKNYQIQKLDNDLFQTARLVTCGLYVNIILNDYVRTILNLNRTDNAWTLDPRTDTEGLVGVPRATGNQVSCEFNLVYRWHSAISRKDEQWINNAYKLIFPEQDVQALSQQAFSTGLRQWLTKQGKEPEKWSIDLGQCTRTSNGAFRDEDLVTILTEATDDVACAFGARQVPLAMKMVEMMGIQQARNWNVATLNEFRNFFQLQPYKRFSQITNDPFVARTLKALYNEPDYVELYPGLVAEDAKESKEPGSGICLGYTTSRAILADAVALVRGDRFYTVDYSPASLTNWGWNQIESDPMVASGHVIYNLFMRALPGWYRGNSIYAMFPFVIKSENRKILKNLGHDHDYNFNRPEFVKIPYQISSWTAVRNILKDSSTFKVKWGDHIQYLIGPNEYMLSGDNEHTKSQRSYVNKRLDCPMNGLDQIRYFYEALTTQLVKIKSRQLRGSLHQLDLCADVANASHAIFVAKLWNIPLKGKGDGWNVTGIEHDKLYDALSTMFAYVFLDGDTGKSFKLKAGAKLAKEGDLGNNGMNTLVKIVCERVKHGGPLFFNTILENMHGSEQMLQDYGGNLLRRMLEEKSVDEAVAIIVPTMAAAVALQAQQITSIIDLYLSEPYSKHWKDIRKCAWSEDPADFEKLRRYAGEAARLRPAATGLIRRAAVDTVVDDNGTKIEVRGPDGQGFKGEQVYVNFVHAGRDEKIFPNPMEIDITRDEEHTIYHGWGDHKCLGQDMVSVAMAAQLRIFAKLKNLRRAPGPQGHLKTGKPFDYRFGSDYQKPIEDTKLFMKEDWSDWFPFAKTLKVHHEGFSGNQDELLEQPTGVPHIQTDLQRMQADGENTELPADSPEMPRQLPLGSDLPRTNGINGVNGTNGHHRPRMNGRSMPRRSAADFGISESEFDEDFADSNGGTRHGAHADGHEDDDDDDMAYDTP